MSAGAKKCDSLSRACLSVGIWHPLPESSANVDCKIRHILHLKLLKGVFNLLNPPPLSGSAHAWCICAFANDIHSHALVAQWLDQGSRAFFYSNLVMSYFPFFSFHKSQTQCIILRLSIFISFSPWSYNKKWKAKKRGPILI